MLVAVFLLFLGLTSSAAVVVVAALLVLVVVGSRTRCSICELRVCRVFVAGAGSEG
jgi:hypothetical protein